MAARSNTTSKIRGVLAEGLNKAISGELSAEDGKNIIGLANQISHSMAVEVKVMAMKSKLGHQVGKFGELKVD